MAIEQSRPRSGGSAVFLSFELCRESSEPSFTSVVERRAAASLALPRGSSRRPSGSLERAAARHELIDDTLIDRIAIFRASARVRHDPGHHRIRRKRHETFWPSRLFREHAARRGG